MNTLLRIVHSLAPGEAGGAESVVRMLTEGLARRGHEVHLCLTLESGSSEHALEEQLRPTAVNVHTWRLPPRAYWREGRLVHSTCREVAAHALHTHGYRSDVVGALGGGSSTPLVSTAHGFTDGDMKVRFYEWLHRRAYRRYKAVLAVSRSVAERLRKGGVRHDLLRLVPNAWLGIERPLEREAARRELRLESEGFVAGWVGRLSIEKGADLLIDALPYLTDLPMDVAILGDGPERVALERRVASAAMVDRVHWLGTVRRAGRLFGAFDLFVLSSRTEGTPIVLLEAMAAGVPIVATRVGGVPDVVRAGEAFLTAPDDPTALAGAIREAYEHPAERRARRDAAQRRLDEAFGAEPWLDAHEEVYREVAGLPAQTRSQRPTDVPVAR